MENPPQPPSPPAPAINIWKNFQPPTIPASPPINIWKNYSNPSPSISDQRVLNDNFENCKSHFACLWRQQARNWQLWGSFLLKIKIERKLKLDSFLLKGENNSKTFKNCQVIRPENPSLKSVQNGAANFNYFLLWKLNRFVSKGINVMVCL